MSDPHVEGGAKAERESILRTLEEIAGEVGRRDAWGDWANFLIQEQGALATKEEGFGSVFCTSRTMEVCIASSLNTPLEETHSKFFHTLLKSVLINTPSRSGGTTGTTIDAGQTSEPDLVDHTHARLHQLSLLFDRCRRRAESNCGIEADLEDLRKFMDRVCNSTAAAVFTLRKPKVEVADQQQILLGSQRGATAVPSAYMPNLPMASNRVVTSSLHSEMAGLSGGTPRDGGKGSDGVYGSTYHSNSLTPPYGGEAGTMGADSMGLSMPDSITENATPRGPGHRSQGTPRSQDIGSMFHVSGKRVLTAAQQVQRVTRLLSAYRGHRDADLAMRQELDQERTELCQVALEVDGLAEDARRQRDELRKAFDDQKLARKVEEERVSLQVLEQEAMLVLLATERTQLENRQRQLMKITREGRETLGILRGRKKHYADTAPLPSSMTALLEKIGSLDKWVEALMDSKKCATCCVSFVNGLEQEAAHCSAAQLATQEEGLNSTIGGATEATVGAIQHQLALVQTLLQARSQIQQVQRDLDLTTKTGAGSANEVLGASVNTDVSVVTQTSSPTTPQVAYLQRLASELADEAARQGTVAEEQLQNLEELSFAWTIDQLPDTLASRSLLTNLEHAAGVHKTLVESLDTAGVNSALLAELGTGYNSSNVNTPRVPDTPPAVDAAPVSPQPQVSNPSDDKISAPAAPNLPTTTTTTTSSSGPTPERKRGLGLPTKLRGKRGEKAAAKTASVPRTTSTSSINDDAVSVRSTTSATKNTDQFKTSMSTVSHPPPEPVALSTVLPSWLQIFVRDFETFERTTLLCEQQLQRQHQQVGVQSDGVAGAVFDGSATQEEEEPFWVTS